MVEVIKDAFKKANVVKFDIKESNVIKAALLDHLINLKINNAAQKNIQSVQQIVDKMPNAE